MTEREIQEWAIRAGLTYVVTDRIAAACGWKSRQAAAEALRDDAWLEELAVKIVDAPDAAGGGGLFGLGDSSKDDEVRQVVLGIVENALGGEEGET